MTRISRPLKLLQEHLEFLDDLRESGITNMYGAGTYLQEEYPLLNKDEAGSIIHYWMKTFKERHSND